MTQKQIGKGGESPVIINGRPGPGLVSPAATGGPSLVFPANSRILPWPSTLKEAQGDPLDAIEGALNLRGGIRQWRKAHASATTPSSRRGSTGMVTGPPGRSHEGVAGP